MIAEATKDASARAKSIAENDANLGSLKNQTWVFFYRSKPLKTFPMVVRSYAIQKIKRLISRPIIIR
jgi:hypothetical protein